MIEEGHRKKEKKGGRARAEEKKFFRYRIRDNGRVIRVQI